MSTPGSDLTDETVRVRRVPKYSVFLALGVAIGILTALVLTFAFDGTEGTSQFTGMVYSTPQVFGFLLLFCIPAAVTLAAIVALIFDRMFAGRAREVAVAHETVHAEDLHAEDPPVERPTED